MKIAAMALALIAGSFGQAVAQKLPPIGGPYPPPFTETLSNNTPLAFGMDADEAARALGTPLNYVRGRPGEEIFLTFRNIGGSGLFYKKDRLFLLFRKGRLAGWKGDWRMSNFIETQVKSIGALAEIADTRAGWKGDWGHNWMWQ